MIGRSRQLYRRDGHLECTFPGRVRLLSLFPGSEPSGISEKIPVLQENSLRWKRRFQNQRLCGFDDRGGEDPGGTHSSAVCAVGT